MTAAEFGRYLEPAIRAYAREKVTSGEWAPEEAVALSRRDHLRLLPDGLATTDQFLFTVRDEQTNQAVATLWLTLRMRGVEVEAYVYDIEVAESQRGRGYGRATMLACFDKARELGADSVGLHVFGHNKTARALYASLGFHPTNINMTLKL
jgi:ribosomal protein S18 acetylase RimI-like enzyme